MRTSLLKLIATVLAFAMLAVACGSDASDENVAETPATSEEAETGEDEAMADEPGTIVDVAVGAGSFTTLVAAVTEAGLVDTLSGEGPFTVFAPTDDAFAAALDALGLTAEELLASDDLAAILTYHVVAGEVDAATAISLDGQSADTVNGAPIDISVVDGNVMINNATVIGADIEASNGIIHIIDTVLLPPTDEAMTEDAMADGPGTIVDVAVGAGSFTTLVAAVTEAGLVETLSGEGPFTVFAPTDDAFAAALDALGLTAEELLASPELGAILTYHVVAGEVDAATAISLDGQSAGTVNGADIDISVVDGNVMINDATVIGADVEASNGIIHIIDTVLLPPVE
jgi:transforming growth factor-beta-induced protein